MFTGIVEDIGNVNNIESKNREIVLDVNVKKIDPKDIVPGESIAINGACLTVTSISPGSFTVEISEETLSKTNLSNLAVGSEINLERSIKVGGRLGGHFVTGHIDGIAKVDSKKKVGNSFEYWFKIPFELTKYIIGKGSVALDGVSLTVNRVVDNSFSVNIIPYTQKETTFKHLDVGSIVNMECDIIGKYVEKLSTGDKNDSRLEYLLKKLRV